MSALLRIADSNWTPREVRKVPILLQKSQKAQRLIFRKRTKQATIADRKDFCNNICQKATCLQRHGRNGSAEPVLRLAEGKARGSIRPTHEKHNGRSLVPAQAGRRQ